MQIAPFPGQDPVSPNSTPDTTKMRWKERWTWLNRFKVVHLLLIVGILVLAFSALNRYLLHLREQEKYSEMLERDKANNPGVYADSAYDRLFESVAAFPSHIQGYQPTTIHPAIQDLPYLCPVDYDAVGHMDPAPLIENFAHNFPNPPAFQLIGGFRYLNSTTCTQPFEGVVLSLLSDEGPHQVTEHWEILYYIPMQGNQKALFRQALADSTPPPFEFSGDNGPWVINVEAPTLFRKRGVISVVSPTPTLMVGGTRYQQAFWNPALDQLVSMAGTYNDLIQRTVNALNAYSATPAEQRTQDQFTQLKTLEKEASDMDSEIKKKISAVQAEDPFFDPATLHLKTVAFQ